MFCRKIHIKISSQQGCGWAGLELRLSCGFGWAGLQPDSLSDDREEIELHHCPDQAPTYVSGFDIQKRVGLRIGFCGCVLVDRWTRRLRFCCGWSSAGEAAGLWLGWDAAVTASDDSVSVMKSQII